MIQTCAYSGLDWRDCQCECCYAVAEQNKESAVTKNELRELGINDRRKGPRNA